MIKLITPPLSLMGWYSTRHFVPVIYFEQSRTKTQWSTHLLLSTQYMQQLTWPRNYCKLIDVYEIGCAGKVRMAIQKNGPKFGLNGVRPAQCAFLKASPCDLVLPFCRHKDKWVCCILIISCHPSLHLSPCSTIFYDNLTSDFVPKFPMFTLPTSPSHLPIPLIFMLKFTM